MLKKIWSFAGSVRLVIPLLILIAVASIVGVVIPQNLPADAYRQSMGGIRAQLILGAGIDHVFSAGWFYALLGLLSVNIVACLASRQWKSLADALHARPLPGPDHVAKLATCLSFEAPGDVQRTAGAVAAYFRRRFFLCATQKHGSVLQVAARSPGFKEAGSVIFHLSILLFFVGGILGLKGGSSYVCELRNGDVAEMRGESFLVRCDWFKVEKNNEGVISGYKSSLAILDRDFKTLSSTIISVNHPMSFKGYSFYQDSYGEQPDAIDQAQLRITGPGLDSSGYVGTFPFDSGVALPGDLMVTIRRFVCDFYFDADCNAVSSRSETPGNPAIEVEIAKGEDLLYKSWVFALYPDAHQDRSHGYTVEFLRYTPLYYTGIRITRNPGAPFIWLAFALMTLGTFLVFYFPQKRFWVFIEPDGEHAAKISFGGASSRPLSAFQSECAKRSGDLKRILNQGACP